jgi:Tol biopolymer transport system component
MRGSATVAVLRKIVLVAGLALAMFAVPAAALDPGETVLVSQTSGGGSADARETVDLSADGRCVVFSSSHAALPFSNGAMQVYLRDTEEDTTTILSVIQGGSNSGDGDSVNPVITPDCRYVAWDSVATNLVAGSPTQRLVYRRDLLTGTTELVSTATGGALPDQGGSTPAMSADGSRIVFSSGASNLADDDSVGADVFLRDLDTDTTRLVSRNDADQAADGPSAVSASISDDGRRVAFASAADNLSAGGVQDAFVRDVDAGTTALVSRATGAGGAGGNSTSSLPKLSGNGTRVAFVSLSSNLGAGMPLGSQQVYLRELGTSQTLVLSRATGAGGAVGNGTSGGEPGLAISGDGDRVVFQSNATNLGASGGSYVRELASSTTERVTPTGVTASLWPSIAGDGAHMSFFTAAGLVATDTDNQLDLYLRRAGGGAGPAPAPTPAPDGTAPPTATPTTLRGGAAFERGTANDLYLACTTLDLYLVDVLPAGRRVAVTGAADLRLVGRTAEIVLDGKRVGRAVIGSGGAFAARVKAPSKRRRAKARYQARVGSTASQKLRLVRRMVATTLTRSGAGLVLRGVVNPPRARKQPAIAVDRFLSCRRRQVVKVRKVRPDRRGRFAVRIKVPAGARAVLYRARTKVPPRAGRKATKGTFTLPRAANIH